MTEAMSINEEYLSYRFTVGIEADTVATVLLPCGHSVDLVARKDGLTQWVDRVCERATTPDFPAHYVPFIDETAAAWHEGTLDAGEYDYPARLAKVAAAVADAAKRVREVAASGSGRTAERAAERRSSEAKAERAALVRLVHGRSAMPVDAIAQALGLTVRSVRRLISKADGPRG